MSETLLGGSVTPETPAPTPETPATPPTKAPEGQPKAWYESLPEALRTEKITRFDSVEKLVDSYNNAQKLISSKGYAPPAPDAPDAEWEAFYARAGRPESPEGYEWEAPEGVELDGEALAAAKSAFHKLGLNPRQFKGVMEFYKNDVARIEEMAAEEQAAMLEASKADLQKKWGDSFDANLKAATVALSKFDDLGVREKLAAAGLLNDASIAEMFRRFAAATAEDRRVDGTRNDVSAKDRIAEIRASKDWQDERSPRRPALVEEMRDLYAKLNGQG